jgi:hypothetical protein
VDISWGPIVFSPYTNNSRKRYTVFKYVANYKDFNGKAHTEELYFHLMVPEFVDLQFNPMFDGDMGEYIKETMRTSEGQKIYVFFKLLMVNSYGRRTEDGAGFTKSEAWTNEFINSLAYEDFFVWIISNPKNAEGFYQGIMPEKMDQVMALVAEQQAQTGEVKKNVRDLSHEELVKLYEAKVSGKAISS